MAVNVSSLPDEVQSHIRTLELENKNLYSEKEEYKSKYEALRRRIFSRKSEKLTLSDSKQECLFNEAEVVHEAVTVEIKSHKRKKSRKKTKPRQPVIPDDLPEVEVIHEATSEQRTCPCCEEEMNQAGVDMAKELHVIPEQLIVQKHVYHKYACSQCKEDSTVITTPRQRFLPGSVAGSGILAYIIQRKYQFGLPLYRISAMCKAIGVDISRQTMSNWIINSGEKLTHFVELLKEELKTTKQMGIDETTFQVLREPGRKAQDISYMFHLRSNSKRPVAYFEYRTGRSTKFLESLLTDYGGVILTDGFSSYDTLAEKLSFLHAGCWSHARRYFYEVYEQDKENKEAEKILELVGSLFKLEEIYDSKKQPRGKLRQRFSAPVIQKINKILNDNRNKYPPKSSMGKAITYAMNQWPKLILFLQNSDAGIHNNDVERGIRPFVIGRKNWLFSVSQSGAHASAALYSLVETAKTNNLNPYDYLTFLFEKFPKCQTDEELKELLPNRVEPTKISEFFKEYCQL